MNVISLKIAEGFLETEIKFNKSFNLIYSKNNSVGKTTLLRCLLYAMGFNIPNTKNFKMEKYLFSLKLKTDSGKELLIKRNDSYCNLIYRDETEKYYSLPADVNELHSIIFETKKEKIISNILGAMYLDQEKGWTLLNRGTVIGSIHFNLHQFIQGISDVDCSDLYVELNYIEEQIKKYKSMLNVANYKEQIEKVTKVKDYDSSADKFEKELAILKSERQPYKMELDRLENVLKKNTDFKKYIPSMQIYVVDKNGEHIPVNEKTIYGFKDNINYITAKKNIIKNKIAQLDNQINNLLQRYKKENKLIQTETESLIEQFDSDISKIFIDYYSVENMIRNLNEKKVKLKNEIDEKTKGNYKLITELHNIISTYAKELGVDENYVKPNKDYIFTSDLKSLSGAIFHKIVFSFKLAYAKILEQYSGINIPIILDSPRGKEVDDMNIKKMVEILKRDFKNHQIFIASIYTYDIPKLNTIELHKSLLENMVSIKKPE